MSVEILGGLAVLGMVVLLALRTPVGLALFLAGLGGYLAIAKPPAVFHVLGSTLLQVGTEYTLSVLPLFVLMGAVVVRAGMSERLFGASAALFGTIRGAEAMATVAASAAFGAVCGSSLATTATVARIAAPNLRQRGYSDPLTGGAIAAGGTLGILIPPSVIMVIYALITGQSVAALFAAGILPGLLLTTLYILTVCLVIAFDRNAAPEASARIERRIRQLAKGWEVILLFGLTIGGIYAGWFTPTEAAAIGVALAIVIGLAFGSLTLEGIVSALRETVITTAVIFFVVLGATFFSYFIIQAKLPSALIELVAAWGLSPLAVILGILAFYLIAGCFLDGIGMMLATVPVFFPVATGLGYDPIWFGILVVIAIEVGLITPPVGMNLFVIKSQVPDIRLSALYRGIVPFLLAQMLMFVVMLAVPDIATWLPQVLFP